MSRRIRFGDEPPLAATAARGLAHGAWRYRVQLAPVYAAGGLAGAGAITHAADWGEYWLIGAGVSAASTVGCWIYHRARESHWLTRVHATAATGAAASWLTAASAVGVLERPLPDLLGLGTIALGVPWWINRRTRSRVSVEQRIEAWPRIAATRPELRGSEVISAVATAFGWQARVKLASGQTGRKAVEARDGIESALEVREGAVRIEPARSNVREVIVHVTEVDPHADGVAWPGPTMDAITDQLTVGPYDDGQDCLIQVYSERGARHVMVCGLTGSGKSGFINLVLAELINLGNAVLWGIDLKGGQELGPWRPLLDRVATTPDEALGLLEAAGRVIACRGAGAGERVWTPTPQRPALVIVCDEAAKLFGEDMEAVSAAETIVLQGRSVGVSLIAAAQDTTTAAWGSTQLRDQLSVRVGFRLKKAKARYMFERLAVDPELLASIDEDMPGVGYVEAPGVRRPAPIRVRWVPDEVIERLVADHAHDRPCLDAASEAAADEPYDDEEEGGKRRRRSVLPPRTTATEVPNRKATAVDTDTTTAELTAATAAEDDLEPLPDDLGTVTARSMGTQPPARPEPAPVTDEEATAALWQALRQGGVRLASKGLEQRVGRKKTWIYHRADDWERWMIKGRDGYRLAPDAPEQPPVLTPA